MDAKALHERVSELFLAACERPPNDRAAWLARVTAGDAALRAEVESLLALDTAPALIDPPALGQGFQLPSPGSLGIGSADASDLGPLPERIGAFTIKGVLGSGGMGVVYLAEQDRPHRQVAIKVVRAGTASASALRRFEFEANVLAKLQHPGIAQVYEAGTATASGGQLAPFFAMEFIRGVPLTEFARKRELTTRECLDLLARVCDAVHHAHQKGIIHRDLKPGNILVDETGQPKILDFGVARATDSDLQATTQRTHIGQIIGTLAYMSPEQVRGNPDELDTGTDVYALGVMAYELLAGKLPFDLSRKPLPEIAQVIRDDEPARLSKISRTLRGDIETIVAKAMAKERDRRYPSADALASDIRRYLKNEPITAHPTSTLYQLRKFTRRHRALVMGTCATTIAVLAGLGGILWQTQNAATRARAEARSRFRADGIYGVVATALRASDPEQGGKLDMSEVDVLTKILLNALDAESLKGDPETEADIRSSIATLLMNTGRMEQAEPINAQVLELYERLYKGDHAKVATAMNDLASIQFLNGHTEGVEHLLVRALEMNRRLYKGDHLEVAASLNNLAVVKQNLGRAAEAEPLLVQVVEMNRRLYKGDHQEVATSLNNLANVREAMGRQAEVEPLYVEALEMSQRLVKGDHPDVARGLNNLALLRSSLGRDAAAEPLFVEALEMYRRLFKGDHPAVATSLNNVGFVFNQLGRAPEAEPYYVESLAMSRRLFAGDHPQVALYLGNLASVQRDMGRAAEAEPLLVEALEMFQRLYEGDHADVANTLNNLALTREVLNRPTEAEALFVQSLEMYKRLFPGDHADVATGLSNLANLRQSLGNTADARPLFDDAIAMLRRLPSQERKPFARVLWRSANARLANGDAAGALPEVQEAVSVGEAALASDHPHLQEYRDALAKCREALGK